MDLSLSTENFLDFCKPVYQTCRGWSMADVTDLTGNVITCYDVDLTECHRYVLQMRKDKMCWMQKNEQCMTE